MTNPSSEDELTAWERSERETERRIKRFKRESHYRAQKIDCCLKCLYSEFNEDYAKCYFGEIDVDDIDWDGICDHFVPKQEDNQ